MIQLVERSYRGKQFRPTPEVLLDEATGLFILATPWGPRSSAKKAIQSIRDLFSAAQQDAEVTSPFQNLTCLNPVGNVLRSAVLMANDLIYREDNKNEYVSGVELLVLAFNQHEWVWIKIGQPNLLLDRFEHFILPISAAIDYSTSYSTKHALYQAPLPSDMLGLHTTSNISVQSFKPSAGDRLILLSRTHVNPALLSVRPPQRQLEALTQRLAEENPEMPFWLGILEFS